MSAAESAAASFRSLAAACTGAVFVRQAVIFSQVESPRPVASSGADATRVGGLIFACDTGELEIIEVHGLNDAMLMTIGPGAGLLIDRTNPAIVALVNQLVSGTWCNPFGFTLQTLESAYLQIRR